MPNYKYRARSFLGEEIEGFLAAADEDELQKKLKEMELYLIDFRVVKPGRTESFVFGRIKRRDLILFTNHLATSLEAGISLIVAMQDYAREVENVKFRKVIEDLIRQVLAGSTLSTAMEKHPRAFSELYVAIIATGETTGNLSLVLKDLVGFLEWQEQLAGQIKQASIYPAFLIGMIVAVITIMMGFTIPKFLPMLTQFGVQLPLPTRILIAVATFFQNYWLLMIAGIVCFVIFYKVSYKISMPMRYFWDLVKIRMPLFGKLQLKIVLSKFAHYFSMLYSSGIGIIEAFVIIGRVVGNEVVRRIVARGLEEIQGGSSIYDSLSKAKLFPQLILRMIQVGESTGTLDVSLQKASDYYDREVPATIKKIFAVFEPMLILIMGGIVLFIALSIFLPIYSLTSSIGAQR